MFEWNVHNVLLTPMLAVALLLAVYAVCARLMLPSEYRTISSRVPSITKTLWTELLVSWDLATKHPKDLLPYFVECFKNYGPVVHLNLAGKSYVLLNDPDDIKILLSSQQYINKGPEYKMMKPWLNEGLLLSSGTKWKDRRRLLTNTFHFKTLDMYIPSINKHSRVLAEKLSEISSTNTEINLMEYITLCSLDIICETVMGTEMNAQKGKSMQYVKSIKSTCRSIIERIFKFWLWNDVIFSISECGQNFYKSVKVLHNYTDNVIKNKRESLNNLKNQNELCEKPTQKKSFLDLLLWVLEDSPDQMTDKDIREEVDTFLFEGHDTSSIAMTMTLLLLGLNQDVQAKVKNELFDIFGDSDRDATMNDLNNMKYLEATIKESLRLYPSVPAFTRQLETTLHLKNYDIPPMTIITVYPYILHRNEDIYPNAGEFIPERFLDDQNKTKYLFGYLPFSAGPRNCIGQKYAMNQMKTVISTVLRKTKIETLGTMEDIKISMQLLIRIESLPNVKFHQL